ncbi:hypothetical protein [Paracoccus hibiscisoli]|uniref:hypothetical protein n=1 Tax=Paracoccus hibiscisoli TaxID=2023261 RepID=UPI0039196FD4
MSSILQPIAALAYDLGLARRSVDLTTRRTPGALWEATRDLHHNCEAHPIGAAVADGSITARHWADWCAALLVLHQALDPFVEPVLRRAEELRADVVAMRPLLPAFQDRALSFAASLDSEPARAGAIYVLTGAHLMGGALTEKRLREAGRDLPTAHLRWEDRTATLAAYMPYRERADAAPAARATFMALVGIMQRISGGTP